MKKPPTKAESEYMCEVALLGCLRCKSPYAELHHPHYCMGKRSSNYDVIPLCPVHHRHGKFGDCVHNGLKTTQINWGITESQMVEKVKELLGNSE